VTSECLKDDDIKDEDKEGGEIGVMEEWEGTEEEREREGEREEEKEEEEEEEEEERGFVGVKIGVVGEDISKVDVG